MNPDEFIAKVRQLEKENADLKEQLRAANNTIRRARDINPVERPSFKRVLKTIGDACMNLLRVPGGWLLKFGDKERRFKRLREIWELLILDDWALSEIFRTAPRLDERRVFHRPILRERNPCIAPPSFGPSDVTFTGGTS